jgi:hypothetical protein
MGLEKEPSDTKPLSGLEIEETKLGAGLAAYRGDRVTVRYSGFLNRGDAFQTDVTTSFTLGERNGFLALFHQTPFWCSKSRFCRLADHSLKQAARVASPARAG